MTASTDVAIDLAPFTLLSRDEQQTHIVQYHRHFFRVDSKTTKAKMQERHAELHAAGKISQPHTHTAAAATSAGELDLTTTLKATERKALKDLVDNDFLQLKAEINQFADDMAESKRQEVRTDYANRGADAASFVARARALKEQYEKDTSVLVAEAKEAGVDLTPQKIDSYDKIKANVYGLKDAEDEAVKSVEMDRRRALNSLERARLTAQRRVLMSGVTREALEILDEIPSAKELMLQAAQERAPQELMG